MQGQHIKTLDKSSEACIITLERQELNKIKLFLSKRLFYCLFLTEVSYVTNKC